MRRGLRGGLRNVNSKALGPILSATKAYAMYSERVRSQVLQHALQQRFRLASSLCQALCVLPLL